MATSLHIEVGLVHQLDGTGSVLKTACGDTVLTDDGKPVLVSHVTGKQFYSQMNDLREIAKSNPGSRNTRFMLGIAGAVVKYRAAGDRWRSDSWGRRWAHALAELLEDIGDWYDVEHWTRTVFHITFEDKTVWFFPAAIGGVELHIGDNSAFLEVDESQGLRRVPLTLGIDGNDINKEVSEADIERINDMSEVFNLMKFDAHGFANELPILYVGEEEQGRTYKCVGLGLVGATLLVAAITLALVKISRSRHKSKRSKRSVPDARTEAMQEQWQRGKDILGGVRSGFMTYENSAEDIFSKILLADRTHPVVADFYDSMIEANVRDYESMPSDAAMVTGFFESATRCRKAWDAAVRLAERVHWDTFTLEQQKSLSQGEKFLQTALNPASTEAEAQRAYVLMMGVLNDIRVVPTAAKNLRVALPAGDTK